MQNYTYQNTLISKKQLRQLLSWSFTTYDCMQACALADELKYLGFQYASTAGISISIEDLRVPSIKTKLIENASQDIFNAEKLYLKGCLTDVERFQKIIDTWNLTSEALKNRIIHFFKNYDPLNSVYIMAFSGARGNLSQVRQLVGMRGLMSDPSGEIMNLPIKKNFREGLTITDYLMSGYGARKGIVDTALKTANSGYLTRRLIDVSQDIVIREKDCLTSYSILVRPSVRQVKTNNLGFEKLIGYVLNKDLLDHTSRITIAPAGTQITENLLKICKEKRIYKFYVRSPLTCDLYRAVCQTCYGWDLATEKLVDIGEAIGILAGQSIGEPGTQLTMRTFHTGGIFTAGKREQVFSPISGLVQLHKSLETRVLRTTRGEDVIVTKTAGSLILVPKEPSQPIVKMRILPNTIVFPKNNQYVSRDTVIGEIINKNRQLRSEMKSIISYKSGEILIPRLKKKVNAVNKSRLIWILFGKLFYGSNSSFLNFYSDYRINQYDAVVRSKLISQYEGQVHDANERQHSIKLINRQYILNDAKLRKLNVEVQNKTHLFELKNLTYLVSCSPSYGINTSFLTRTTDGQVGCLLTNKFQTLTGGILFYNVKCLSFKSKCKHVLEYVPLRVETEPYVPIVQYNTIFWLSEEIHEINCDLATLPIEHGDFVSAGFRLTSKNISRISGFVNLKPKPGLKKILSIKPGVVYEGTNFRPFHNKVYYPGELLLSTIDIKALALCELFTGKTGDQLLIRPLNIYEISKVTNLESQNNSSALKFSSRKVYMYLSGQTIQAKSTLNLILELLLLNNLPTSIDSNKFNVEFTNLPIKKTLLFQSSENRFLINFLAPDLRYRNIKSCLLTQSGQFLSKYSVFGYLESITQDSLEIVKIKLRKQSSKQVLVISNEDCVTVTKQELPGKKLNDLVVNSTLMSYIGQIIIDNKHTFTIQKGQPYFFPNCTAIAMGTKAQLHYKMLPDYYFPIPSKIIQDLSTQYYDVSQTYVRNYFYSRISTKLRVQGIISLSTFFLAKNKKLYTCLTPEIFKKLQVNNSHTQLRLDRFLTSIPISQSSRFRDLSYDAFKSLKKPKSRIVMVKMPEITGSARTNRAQAIYNLSLLKFEEQRFKRSTKAVGLYSITEDYFEQDVNHVFCTGNEFIESGTTIGLLNLEKEITGDIVQGLPRIEEILEARKKRLGSKNVPSSKKKGLLTYVSNLTPNFEFKKIGVPINESDKINPHKLLKAYFNYYGVTKHFFCTRKKIVTFGQLTNNYEGSYKSFKKVQLFILNSVQNVYLSQGVTINNKHLEVIIKQMTTKVLITYEGNAPLLRREVVDLYHIKCINKIVRSQTKEVASYVPFLLGITKSALNNPSFLSAASFQETTRVLTKAAIEGRIDWLRGLKENIVIGHLIPAGTGFQTYRDVFQKPDKPLPRKLLKIKIEEQIKLDKSSML